MITITEQRDGECINIVFDTNLRLPFYELYVLDNNQIKNFTISDSEYFDESTLRNIIEKLISVAPEFLSYQVLRASHIHIVKYQFDYSKVTLIKRDITGRFLRCLQSLKQN